MLKIYHYEDLDYKRKMTNAGGLSKFGLSSPQKISMQQNTATHVSSLRAYDVNNGLLPRKLLLRHLAHEQMSQDCKNRLTTQIQKVDLDQF